ncbi:hypothetical protein [Shimia sp. SDUM112013]|uniref:hypothetical protein n=1 Tax=Shimia sp. SDUM112013 TaxID=3136160 RepID=UPI0032EB5A31
MPRPSLASLLVLAVAAFVAAAYFDRNPAVQAASAYAEDVATASAVLYVSLRGVNAVLSTAQEVELGGSLVVSGSVQPLKALEPVDDTIERISDLVFAVMVFTGVLAVAMGPVSATGCSLIALATCVWILDRRFGGGTVAKTITRKLGWYGAFLGLAIPLAFVIASLVADRMTEGVWAEHDAIVQEITASVSAQADLPAGDESWFSAMAGLAGDAERYQTLMAEVFARADDLIRAYIAILSVFVFRIVILPLLVMGAFFVLVRAMAQRAPA